MKSAVTISLVPEAKGGPFVFWDGLADGCAQASKLGFDAVEIFPPSADALNITEVRSLLDQHHLRVAAVGTGAGWVKHKLRLTDPDAKIRHKAIEFVMGIIDVAGKLEAPAIIGSMQGGRDIGAPHADLLQWLGEALEELSEHSAKYNQVLLYEPLNRYETEVFNRVGDAAAFLRKLKSTHIRLLCDLFHMNIEECSIGDAIHDAGPLAGHIHWADSNRHAMGFGHTDAANVVAALRKMGYSGYLSAEVLPLPNSLGAAQQSIESFRYWTK